MKKKIFIYTIIGLVMFPFVTTICLYSIYGSAWKNKHPDNLLHDLNNWAAYNRDTDYGTHDWIAELGLWRIKDDPKWITKDGQEFWTENRIKIYLFATLGPDIKVTFYDYTGVPIQGRADTGHHNLRFNEDTRQVEVGYPNLLTCITDVINGANTPKTFWEGLIKVLSNGDCDAAAFYMGMLAHYIGDTSCFPHIITLLEHTTFEDNIARRTDCTAGLKKGPFSESERYECFIVNLGFPIPVISSPTEACVNLGYDTMFDSRVKSLVGTYTAQWMHDNFIYMKNNWPTNRDDWFFDIGVRHNFMYRVEKSLQYAVECVAASLNWVIDTHLKYHGELKCICSEGETPTKSRTVQRFLSDYLFFFLWMQLGMFAAIYSFAIALTPLKTI